MASNRSCWWWMPVMAMLVVGCAMGPRYRRPVVDTPAAWQEQPGITWQAAAPRDETPRGAWWEIFGDDALNALATQAVEANQTLQVALAQLERARAEARLPVADLLPTVESHPSYSHFQRTLSSIGGSGSLTNDDIHVPLDLSYEVDLWGKIRRTFEAKQAEAQASAAALETVRLSVTAEVVRTYFALRALDEERAALQQAVTLRARARQIVGDQRRAGLAGALEDAQAVTDVSVAEAELADVERRHAALRHALAVLCGQAPSVFTWAPSSALPLPPAVPAGIPSDVLERRPDVAEAERLVKAANARIGVAQAAFFPVVTLTGSGGWQSAKLESLITADSFVWSMGPSVSIPVFSGGRGRANLRAARADYRAAVAQYRQQVLTAFQEVEDALAAVRWFDAQLTAQQQAVTAAQQAASLSLKRHQQGLVGFLEVVDTERARLEAVRRAAHLRGQRLSATTLLIKALGGGWSAPAP